MSPKQKTATKRHASSRPNKRNMRKRRLQIQENAILPISSSGVMDSQEGFGSLIPDPLKKKLQQAVFSFQNLGKPAKHLKI